MKWLRVALATAFALATLPALGQEGTTERGPFLFANGGGFSHLANLNDAGTADFKTGFAVGAGGGYRVNRNVALRGNFQFARAEARVPFAPAINGTKFNRYLYDADVQLRYPTDSGVAPFMFVGGGVINVHQAIPSDPKSFYKGAGKVGLGLEYRIPDTKASVFAQGTGWMYKWDRLGFNRTQFDTTWTGGFMVHFDQK